MGVTPRGLHKQAVIFSDAAEVIRGSHIVDPLPKYFLWGRAIELVLKSFLSAEGMPINTLRTRQFGHNIDALFNKCETLGIYSIIGKRSDDKGIIHVLNIDYSSKRFEYRETNRSYCLSHEGLTRRLIKRLLKGVDFHLERKGL